MNAPNDALVPTAFLDLAANRAVLALRGKVIFRDPPLLSSLENPMSRIFAGVFCFVVVFLVVYNGLQFPTIASNATARIALKVGAVVITVLCARLIFKPTKSRILYRRAP
jgi:hypothetical protein